MDAPENAQPVHERLRRLGHRVLARRHRHRPGNPLRKIYAGVMRRRKNGVRHHFSWICTDSAQTDPTVVFL